MFIVKNYDVSPIIWVFKNKFSSKMATLLNFG